MNEYSTKLKCQKKDEILESSVVLYGKTELDILSAIQAGESIQDMEAVLTLPNILYEALFQDGVADLNKVKEYFSKCSNVTLFINSEKIKNPELIKKAKELFQGEVDVMVM